MGLKLSSNSACVITTVMSTIQLQSQPAKSLRRPRNWRRHSSVSIPIQMYGSSQIMWHFDLEPQPDITFTWVSTDCIACTLVSWIAVIWTVARLIAVEILKA